MKLNSIIEYIKTHLMSIKIYAAIVTVLYFFATIIIIYNLASNNSELKGKIEEARNLNDNNILASQDSLRKYLNIHNEAVFQKLAFVMDMNEKQEKELQDLGWKLQTMQKVTLSIKDMFLKDTVGHTLITDSTLTRKFKFDTSIVFIEGLTSINMKSDSKSFTSMKLHYKPIPLTMGISKNSKGQFLGTVKSPIKDIEISYLGTEVDPDLYQSVIEKPKFFDLLKLGLMLGLSTDKGMEFYKGRFMYGFSIDYDSMGIFLLTDGYGNRFGVKASKSISSFFK